MISRKLHTLNNVLHVTDIRNNWVSDLLLSKNNLRWFFRVINLYPLKVVCL
jgi:hypothetical protein